MRLKRSRVGSASIKIGRAESAAQTALSSCKR